MTPQVKAAREHIISLVHLYAPVHQAVSTDAKHKLEAAMDALQAAAVAGLQAPAPAAPLPAGSAPPPAVTDSDTQSPPQGAEARQNRRARSQGQPAVPAPTGGNSDTTDAPL